MIDTNSMGIPMIYQIQRDKYFSLPTYDLNTTNRVKVTRRLFLKRVLKTWRKKVLWKDVILIFFVSFKVADIVGQKAAYVHNKGLDDDIYKQLIIKALESMGSAEKALPEVLNEDQKSKKVSNLLQAMKDEGIVSVGSKRYAKWVLTNNSSNPHW